MADPEFVAISRIFHLIGGVVGLWLAFGTNHFFATVRCLREADHSGLANMQRYKVEASSNKFALWLFRAAGGLLLIYSVVGLVTGTL